jgi:pimeloyl-ACP methyl ester carboxylesterase
MKKLVPFLLGRYINTMAHIAPGISGRHGFRLFCYPFRAPLKHYHKSFMDTAERTQIVVDDLKIQLYKWGTGENKILFLHGWQSHSFRWKNYIDKFPLDKFTLYAIDAPGHGMSSGNFLTVPIYSNVVEEVINELDGVHSIISHSLGAFTTLYTLYRLPELPVQKLVLLASPGEATEFIEFYKETLQLSQKSVDQILDHFQYIIDEPVTFFSASKFAASVKQQTLIIHDEGDDETSYNHSVSIHRAMKDSKLELTKGLGHNLKSKEIVQKVQDFVESSNVRAQMEIA